MGKTLSHNPNTSWRMMASQKEGKAMPSVETSMMSLSAGLPRNTAASIPMRMPTAIEKINTPTAMEPVTAKPRASSTRIGSF
jgi:hypothetical protein